MRCVCISFCLLPFLLFAGPIAEKMLSEMTLEEKIGQLFVAPVSPLHEELSKHQADWAVLLNQLHIGNAIVKQSDSASQIRLLNHLQNSSKFPLLVLADAEWGLGMRISDAISFPRNMTLGAVQDLQLLEDLGSEIGREARLVGIHMNLAPVVDVNNNPNNPVIHMRSFGDCPEEVSKRGEAMIRGMKQGRLLTCIKHFPGHGDTRVDSHFGLPQICHSKSRLSSIEFPPFERGIQAGSDAVMTAHLLVSAIDSKAPATLSYPVLTDLLRGHLQFRGLIVSDALNMKALTGSFEPEEIAVTAHGAGVDLLLYGAHLLLEVDSLVCDSIPRAYRALLQAYREKAFPISRLDASVRRILEAKESLHLHTLRIADPHCTLQTVEACSLKELLFEAAITHLGPPFPAIHESTAYLSIGCPCKDLLKDSFFSDHTFFTQQSIEGLIEILSKYQNVVVSLRNIQSHKENFGLSLEQISFLHDLSSATQLTICLFGTPYAASLLPSSAAILIGYEEEAQRAMAKVLKKKIQATGKIPVTLSSCPTADS